MSDPTRVFYRPLFAPEAQLPFLRWEPNGTLVVLHQPGSPHAGQEWRISKRRVRRLLRSGRLRLEGERPEWARV